MKALIRHSQRMRERGMIREQLKSRPSSSLVRMIDSDYLGCPRCSCVLEESSRTLCVLLNPWECNQCPRNSPFQLSNFPTPRNLFPPWSFAIWASRLALLDCFVLQPSKGQIITIFKGLKECQQRYFIEFELQRIKSVTLQTRQPKYGLKWMF